MFFVAFSSLTPFSSAVLNSADVNLYSFNIDTIVYTPAGTTPVPAPPTLLLSALALLALRARSSNATT